MKQIHNPRMHPTQKWMMGNLQENYRKLNHISWKKHGFRLNFSPTNQSIESHDYVSILDVFGSVWWSETPLIFLINLVFSLWLMSFHVFIHRIGWWENFNRKALYLMVKNHGFRLNFSLKPIQWFSLVFMPVFDHKCYAFFDNASQKSFKTSSW